LHRLFERPMIDYPFEVLAELGVRSPIVVLGDQAASVKKHLDWLAVQYRMKPAVVLQRKQLGTGHAVMMARKRLKKSGEDILIWPGDMPLVQSETIRNFLQAHRESGRDVSVLSSLMVEPYGYGRCLRMGGKFYAIREELDASESERAVHEVNTGIYLFKSAALFRALKKIRPQNKKNEYYLTDAIEVLGEVNANIEAFPLALAEEALGINSRQQLAEATGKMNQREIRKHMQAGVTVVAPDQTFIAPGVKIGRDTIIYPWS